MITSQDFDRLSAYVDNQLSASEKARLEARLAREPELKAALADLRLTVRVLRSLPTVRPPRNFTLSRAQAEAHARPRLGLFPALRLATALAAFAFIAVVASDLFVLQSREAAPAAAPEVALSVAQVTASPETDEVGGAAGAEAQSTPTAQVEVLAPLAVTPTEQTEAAADQTTAPTATPETSKALRLTMTSTPTPAVIAEAQDAVGESAGNSAANPPSAQPPALPPLRYMEIGLAVLTVLLALAAWQWRKR